MTHADWLLAALLITSNPLLDLPDPGALEERFHLLRGPLISLALEWEILDPRETRFTFASAKDFYSDLMKIRRNYQELQDAPTLADSIRFPDRAVVNELLVFNRAYRKYLEERQPIDVTNAEELRRAIREVDQLYQIWDAVRDSRCEYYYITVRRQALKKLRELLPAQDYQVGRLPPHVPIWRFQQIP